MKRRNPSNKKPSSKSPRGGRGGFKDFESQGRDVPSQQEPKPSGINDFTWYNRNPLLTAAAGSIPYPYRPGMVVPLYNTAPASSLKYVIPGIMALDWVPTLGNSANATDPASIVGKEIFAKVRESFSGSIDADAPDFVIYLMALDSIFAYIEWLKRVYRAATYYTGENFQVPDTLLRAMGFTTTQREQLRQNKMRLFQNITELIEMTKKFRCPDVFDVLNRHRWMSENIYTDSPIINSQWYIFNLVGVYQYTTDTNNAGMLKSIELGLSTMTTDVVASLYTFGRNLINALANSDDAYIISGYLMRAYEGVGQFQVLPLGMGEEIVPVYVPEVLAQIENSTTIGVASTASLTWNNVTQEPSTNAVICKPVVPNWNSGITYPVDVSPFLSIRNENPTVIETVEASRLCVYVDPSGNLTCATEIPMAWNMYTMDEYGAPVGPDAIPSIAYVNIMQGGTAANVATTVFDLANLSQWDWAPKIVIDQWQGTTPVHKTVVAGDVHNLTVLSPSTLLNLHRICLYSEFNSFASYN